MTARVLVVDDMIANVKLLEVRLTSEYFDVTTAMSGAEALRACEASAFDIILLDDKLADGSTSVENVPALRPLLKGAPLCIVSKDIDAEHLRDTAILDVYDIVDKFNLRTRLKQGMFG